MLGKHSCKEELASAKEAKDRYICSENVRTLNYNVYDYRVIPSTIFKKCYDRGDLPIVIDFMGAHRKVNFIIS